ncbi:hypothetical protein NKH77_21290 [Streptomyces sp. M19]
MTLTVPPTPKAMCPGRGADARPPLPARRPASGAPGGGRRHRAGCALGGAVPGPVRGVLRRAPAAAGRPPTAHGGLLTGDGSRLTVATRRGCTWRPYGPT